MSYFIDPRMISADPALQARSDRWDADIGTNRLYGTRDAFQDPAKLPDNVDPKKLIVVCAADTLLKPLKEGGPRRIDILNDEAKKTGAYVVVAGAGHYALSIPKGETEPPLKIAHAAITNFSVGNSHTKAFAAPRADITYFVATHCASEDLPDGKDGFTAPTLQNLHEAFPRGQNIRTFDALLAPRQSAESGQTLVGTGTGAPTAAVALIAALRHQAHQGPVSVKLYGFDGTDQFIMDKDTLPQEYLDRLKNDHVLVKLDDRYYPAQGAFLDQMRQLAFLANKFPELIANIEVDNTSALTARIFNVRGKPRQDFEIVQLHQVPHLMPRAPGL